MPASVPEPVPRPRRSLAGAASRLRWVWPLALVLLACSKRPTVLVYPYPAYTPDEASLFDDVAAPEIFGVATGRGAISSDPKLPERTRRSDSVLVAKVATINRVGTREHAYQLVLEPALRLAGAAHDQPIEIRVDATGPAFSLVNDLEERVIGKTVVFFFRRYNVGGEVGLHWHAEPDTHDVRVAVQQSVTDAVLASEDRSGKAER